MKRQGSSLLLVMLIIAGIITVVFSTQRLALVQFAQTGREEDNIQALYAAKSGIEDGLLRYRFNRDVELTNQAYNLNTAEFKNNMTSLTKKAKDPSYELQIQYKADKIENIAINSGESIDIAGIPNVTSALILHYEIDFNTCPSGSAVQFQQLRQTSTELPATVYTPLIVTRVTDPKSSGDIDVKTAVAGSPSLTNIVRVRAVNCDVTLTANLTGGQKIDGLQTKIISTGYYGSTKRTLVAEIDRRSGNIQDIYELTLYSGNKSIFKKSP